MIRAPFTVVYHSNPFYTKWLLLGLGLERLSVYHGFPKSKMAVVWGYQFVQYLGSMQHHGEHSTWEQPVK